MAAESKQDDTNIRIGRTIGRLLHLEPKAGLIKDWKGNLPIFGRNVLNDYYLVDDFLKVNPEAISMKNNNEENILDMAIHYTNNLHIIEMIVKKKPDLISQKNAYTQTPLHLAAQLNKYEIFCLLYNTSPNSIHIKTREGYTPIHLSNDYKIIEKIMRKNFPLLYNQDNNGRTPLYNFSNYTEEYLRNAPEAAYIKDKSGNFPIHLEAKRGEIENLKAIFKIAPETILVKNNEGESVLDMVKHKGIKIQNQIKNLMKKALFIQTIRDRKECFIELDQEKFEQVEYLQKIFDKISQESGDEFEQTLDTLLCEAVSDTDQTITVEDRYKILETLSEVYDFSDGTSEVMENMEK